MIHPAATLVLVREHGGALEALMMRRHSAIAFMGGMWVFPGGRMDAADQSPEALSRILPGPHSPAPARLKSMQDQSLDPAAAVGLYIAACREAFEESGVLLASDSAGEPCAPDTASRLAPRREEVTADASAFVRMLRDEDLYIDLRRLVYWSHWITPSMEPKRFDTRFFVAMLPHGQAASADHSELTEHVWIEPAAAVAAQARGELMFVAPTQLTLEDLAESHARHGSAQAMLDAEGGRETPAVMPKIELAAERVRIVMPWDPGYASVAGEGCEPAAAFPGHLARRPSVVTMARPSAPSRQ
ncbi:MAG TPA: hypothetical protein PL152_04705 [Steroidobacteraceae bacterium]|nr:hypothetical protein [Steroidobacteraceae bacterium]